MTAFPRFSSTRIVIRFDRVTRRLVFLSIRLKVRDDLRDVFLEPKTDNAECVQHVVESYVRAGTSRSCVCFSNGKIRIARTSSSGDHSKRFRRILVYRTGKKLRKWERQDGRVTLDKIKDGRTRGNLGVTSTAGKTRGNRLRWFGHVERRNDDDISRVIGGIRVERNRGEGKRVDQRRDGWKLLGKIWVEYMNIRLGIWRGAGEWNEWPTPRARVKTKI